ADIAEWAAALRAVELSGDTFRVVELGCGWGCWMLNTGCAARSLGKKVHLIGIEGDKDHVAMAVKSMSVNNFTEDQFKIYHGIAANESGVALFPIADDAAIQWGSAPLLGVDPAARRAAVKTGKYIELPVVGIQKIANEVGAIDLLHIDIQGGEFDFVSSSMHALKQHVAYILIGTHSRQIEGRIMELMLAEGWRLEIERPAFFNMHNEGPQVSVDGVQGWRNLRMLPD
ncbi:MAG: FkbM family methyltransferase, partial [Hyphomicrobiales bacterium]|nr:FkbM family methyltransferase [Hyphomicrobiales bacterium]